MMALGVKRPKKANFSEVETSMLISEIKTRYNLLKLNTRTADVCAKKRQAWQEITNRVNAVGRLQRSTESVKKRWSDLYSEARKILRHGQGTGRGPPDTLRFHDEVLEITGKRKTLDGVATLPKAEPLDSGVSDMLRQVGGSWMIHAPSGSAQSLSGEVIVQDSEAALATDQHTSSAWDKDCSRATSRTTCNQGKQSETVSDDTGDMRAAQQAAIASSDDTELSDSYLKSCIQLNNVQTQLGLLQQEKTKLEIRLLKKRLREDDDWEDWN